MGNKTRRAKTKKQMVVVLLCTALLVFLAACSAGRSAPTEIVLGASIPQTGSLASFGVYEKWGYQKAVDEINQDGGLFLQAYDKKLPVKLVLYDDQSKPEQVTQNVQRLILDDRVHGLLGSATPPLVLPGATVAEREKVPMVTGIVPVRSFIGANPNWKYVWDLFFDEVEMTDKQFLAADRLQTNKKVALFTDNEPDGVVMGKLWQEKAQTFGYQIAAQASFPVGTTDFGDMIRKAKEAQAEVVIAQMLPPDAISLVKQMKTLDYKPKAVFLEKGAEPVQFANVLGEAATGIMVSGYWHPSLSYPGAETLKGSFEKETGETYSQHIADTYSAAQILLDAIKAAGTLDPVSINEAIGKTDKTYVVGPIDFTKGPGGHASVLPTFMLQWQEGQIQIVYPDSQKTGTMLGSS
ncbi:amino acid ABC transporter substrate-binding protein [Brevibacillus fluminis]|uniref:amino acid ABC transporter substrate-binding protein n=1 Tax=Brevibacillus fluminis TaxID=511487 RepID=UPI003F892CD8